VQDIPNGTEAKAITVEDRLPSKELLNSAGGRITLIGDAAHSMTMCISLSPSLSPYDDNTHPNFKQLHLSRTPSTRSQFIDPKVRGEAANHGIADVAALLRELFERGKQETTLVKMYEMEMEMIRR
jgi:hypothetical protein